MLIYKLINIINTLITILTLKVMFGASLKIGFATHFRKGFHCLVNQSARITIGRNCFFNNYCSLNALQKISIGNDCLFGENVKIYDHNHIYSDRTKKISLQGYGVGEINIGNNCWIGSNVVILKNVTIGNNVVIGAGCLIYESIPDNVTMVNKQNLQIINRS